MCVREREREGGFPPVSGGCGPRVSCFLISTSILFILSPSQIRKDSQEVAQAAEGGSGQGMNVCVCVYARRRDVTQANLPLLWLGRCYFVHLKDVKTGGSLTFVIAKSQ